MKSATTPGQPSGEWPRACVATRTNPGGLRPKRPPSAASPGGDQPHKPAFTVDDLKERAVNCVDQGAARFLMQVVDILRDNRHANLFFHPGNRSVARVRLCRCNRLQHGIQEISKTLRLPDRRLHQPLPSGECVGKGTPARIHCHHETWECRFRPTRPRR